jgi:toxin ParE1/3/4
VTHTIVPRAVAKQDVDDAMTGYVAAGAPDAAMRFIDALEEALAILAEHPQIGSPRWADELALPGLRSWPVRGHPFLVFYVPRADHVDVWRVLHMRRDLLAVLDEDD